MDITEAITMAQAIYRRPGGAVGCCLHLVLDDCNVEDEDVALVLAAADAAGHEDCQRLAGALLAMGEAEREAVALGVG